MTTTPTNKQIGILLTCTDTSLGVIMGEDSQVSFSRDGASPAEQVVNGSYSRLQSPDLSRLQLVHMLRRAYALQHREDREREICWKAFLAGYLSKNANSNSHVADQI